MSAQRPALLVAQSGGPTAAINASLAGVVESAIASNSVGAVLGARFGIDGVLGRDVLDLRASPASIWSRIRTTPSAALGSCRHKLDHEQRERALDNLIAMGVGYLIYIGGNDSADTALSLHQLAETRGYDLRVISVPKTIDNDLPGTDHCPGYGSAARYVAQTTQDVGLDTEAMRHTDPIKLVEVMGRDAGWLAAAAILGREDESQAPHLICVPERQIEVDAFLGAVENAYRRFGYVVAVVAETIRDGNGRPLGSVNEVLESDAFGHPTLAGAAARLSALAGRMLGVKARYDKPGTAQRMSSALSSPTDLDEAYAAGAQAVRYALDGRSAIMVGFRRQPGSTYRCTLHAVSLEDVANRQRLLPPEFLGDDPFSVTAAFSAYAMPLIGPPLEPYARLSN